MTVYLNSMERLLKLLIATSTWKYILLGMVCSIITKIKQLYKK